MRLDETFVNASGSLGSDSGSGWWQALVVQPTRFLVIRLVARLPHPEVVPLLYPKIHLHD